MNGRIAAAAVLLSTILWLQPFQAQGKTLSYYVTKYKKTKISLAQSRKIARYNHLIKYYCSIAYIRPQYKVNPDFIKALMIAESNGNPKAISKKGAKGLCQIMYPTGLQAAKELAQKNIQFRYVSKRRLLNLKQKDLYSPSINILLTCYLISKYNAAYEGKLDLVVAAWNAGENSIVNGRPPQYTETLNLIGKVNGYFIYFRKH